MWTFSDPPSPSVTLTQVLKPSVTKVLTPSPYLHDVIYKWSQMSFANEIPSRSPGRAKGAITPSMSLNVVEKV